MYQESSYYSIYNLYVGYQQFFNIQEMIAESLHIVAEHFLKLLKFSEVVFENPQMQHYRLQ